MVMKRRSNGEGSFWQLPDKTWVHQITIGRKENGAPDRKSFKGRTKAICRQRIGVAGFLSGMALATSNIPLFMAHPFVVMLKPAVAMSAQPDFTVVAIALIETIIFLFVGLWTAKHLRYE